MARYGVAIEVAHQHFAGPIAVDDNGDRAGAVQRFKARVQRYFVCRQRPRFIYCGTSRDVMNCDTARAAGDDDRVVIEEIDAMGIVKTVRGEPRHVRHRDLNCVFFDALDLDVCDDEPIAVELSKGKPTVVRRESHVLTSLHLLDGGAIRG